MLALAGTPEAPAAGRRDSDPTLGGALPTGRIGVTATGLEDTSLTELAEAGA